MIAIAYPAASASQLATRSLPIDMEVAMQRGAPGSSAAEWAKLLNGFGVRNARIRSARASDKPSVEPVHSRSARRYKVVAVLDSRNQLILPGGKFGLSDSARLQKFLEELPARTDDIGVERGRFDLTQDDFERLFASLSKVSKASTAGAKPSSVVKLLTEKLSSPIVFDPGVEAKLKLAKPLVGQYQNMATGTALSAALRETGLAFAPEAPRSQSLRLRVAPLEKLKVWWPVGWKPAKVDRLVVPTISQMKEIEIGANKLSVVLDAFEKPMGVPFVLDQLILSRRKIDPTAIQVTFPRRRTSIRRAVDNMLAQARLAGELRVDEAGRPFYWITQWGKHSPRAAK